MECNDGNENYVREFKFMFLCVRNLQCVRIVRMSYKNRETVHERFLIFVQQMKRKMTSVDVRVLRVFCFVGIFVDSTWFGLGFGLPHLTSQRGMRERHL